ncbi:MAG: RepB family plasmid replication initiator protein [Candidatus Dadabacteria bacterium]|nr:MAG: RepB family plasmid replication initiator protein [Candidatus Dadabacteria bacterium]
MLPRSFHYSCEHERARPRWKRLPLSAPAFAAIVVIYIWWHFPVRAFSMVEQIAVGGRSADEILKKHTGAVHIANRLTLLQRKCSNVLLHNAFEDLLTEEKHQIRIADLCDALGISTNNYETIKDAIRALTGTLIEWNIFGRDRKNEWTVTSILASARFKDGICEYTYSPHLRELLYNPNIFARLNLQVQRGFGSKHAITLWEFLVSELCVRRADKTVYSDFMLIDQFRELMGLDDGEYAQFRDLNRYVIKAAIAEVNAVSDIEAEVEYKREGRKVVALRFIARRKEAFQLPLALGSGEEDLSEGLVSITTPEKRAELVQALVQRQASPDLAETLVRDYPPALIEFQIEHYDYLRENGKEPQSGGWWKGALKENWQPPRGFKSRAERRAEQMHAQLVKQARRAFERREYEDAIAFAESSLKLRTSQEAQQLLTEAKKALVSAERQKAIDAYRATLSDDELIELEAEAEQRIQQKGGLYLDGFRRDGTRSIFFGLVIDEILVERLQRMMTQDK